MHELKPVLSNDDFWKDPAKGSDSIFEQFDAEMLTGFFMSAPHQVDIDQFDRLPVVMYQFDEDENLSITDFENRGLIIATDLETNSSRVNFFMTKDGDRLEEDFSHENQADAISGTSLIISTQENMQEQLEINWEPGLWHFTTIIGNIKTNSVVVKFVSEKAPTNTLQEKIKQLPAGAHPSTGDGVQFSLQPSSPAQTNDVGVQLSINDKVMSGNDSSAMVYGSFRLPVLPHELNIDGNTAVVPVNVVVTGSEKPAPVVVSLRVPVASIEKNEDGLSVAEGYFSFHLQRIFPQPLPAQAYQLFIFNSAHVFGPWTFTVLND